MEERGHEEMRGAKGGAAESLGSVRYYAVPETERGWWLKDRVRWGPVWAGALLALVTHILLTALGVAIFGLSRPATAVNAPLTVSTGLGIWMAVAALISLFLGGLFAARLAGIAGTWNGIWNGVVVWALAITLWLLAVSLGATSLLGIAAGYAGQAGITPGAGAATVPPEQAAEAVRTASSGALWFFIGGVLSLIAAAIGGAVGSRAEVEVTAGSPETQAAT